MLREQCFWAELTTPIKHNFRRIVEFTRFRRHPKKNRETDRERERVVNRCLLFNRLPQSSTSETVKKRRKEEDFNEITSTVFRPNISRKVDSRVSTEVRYLNQRNLLTNLNWLE
ncbi:hypothetical protein KIN20_017999 [Parelaphostrongylus tenuis]|uniref:Uncharacterized protein n=1 Tax=Parelaphostrongylus tenuis TaxID=148309 RepID=A0AAD5QRT6_PARTN|nr:hypothetical protein KIN20_017999 [Parelaphostrongylus tenuis]